MNNMKKFNDIRYNFLIESVNNFQDEELELVLEFFDYGKYQRAAKKLIKELGVNLYYVGTFGVSIAALYPVIHNLIETGKFNIPATVENVVLMTICAITVLVHENKEKAKKLFSFAKEKGITDEDLDKVINQIKTIKGIFTEIAQNFGKVVTTFTDMLAYTGLLVPFTMVLNTLITQGKISPELLVQSLPALTLSLGAMGFKLLMNRIMHKLEIVIKGTDKFKNKENIKPLLVNDELKSPELKPEKVKI